ncbi:MAG: helix-turn-helix domain-containing protein [Ardenticatenaceae bacterium]|nr:helix-turn-helix domain-containing protein [Ardenticatenaceae bacterium]
MPKVIHDEDIFEVTINALLAHGFAGAKTKEIAEAAGVSEVTLYRKYGSKAQLVAAAINYQLRPFEENNFRYTGDLAADLKRIIELYDRSTGRDIDLFPQIFSEMVRYPELKGTLAGPFSLISNFGKLITRYQSEGKLREQHPLHTVGALLGPLIINKMLRNADPDIPIPPIDLEAHIDQFIDGHKR